MDDILTMQEAGAMLKLHPRTVVKLARAGKLPAKKLGGSWRFSRMAIEQFIAAPTPLRVQREQPRKGAAA